MKITTANFLKSAMAREHYPKDRKPEFAFVGRSNVGKSTLLNLLLGKKGLAKTSGTPGKTRCVNFFEVNGKLYFVDLPGYGYAKVSKAMKSEWNALMYAYLRERGPLRMVVALMDARHKPTDKDLHMLELLEGAEVPTLIVATKIDKVKRSQRRKHLAVIQETLGLEGDDCIIPFSAVSGEGQRELWQVIDGLL